ncbi:MAG: hypothetical protein GWN86_20275 [Desulfobacterales bacterium]|nr:hypothetical protein [Desulfobacterales bacterium]
MPKKERSPIDRRSGSDRRKAHSLDYFLNGGVERRSWIERRSQNERRKDWVRATQWSSVFIGDLSLWEIPAR